MNIHVMDVWCSGYHISLTPKRSWVRNPVCSSFFFFAFCYVQMFFFASLFVMVWYEGKTLLVLYESLRLREVSNERSNIHSQKK